MTTRKPIFVLYRCKVCGAAMTHCVDEDGKPLPLVGCEGDCDRTKTVTFQEVRL